MLKWPTSWASSRACFSCAVILLDSILTVGKHGMLLLSSNIRNSFLSYAFAAFFGGEPLVLCLADIFFAVVEGRDFEAWRVDSELSW